MSPLIPEVVQDVNDATTPPESPVAGATANNTTNNTTNTTTATLKATASTTSASTATSGSGAGYQLIDIRGHTEQSNTTDQLVSSILTGLSTKSVPFTQVPGGPVTHTLRSIPTLVLYDDKGLEIFDKITYLEEYYLTNAEKQIFEDHGDEIMGACVEDGGVLVELGVGSMRKTRYLLESIVRQKKSVTYYAVDLAEQSLVESLSPLAQHFPTIKFVGLLGTYDDSLAYVRNNIPTINPKTGHRVTRTILWLGSSIGNLTRKEAADFLKRVKEAAMDVGDTFLCGIDRRNDPKVVKLAYDDPAGVTREFIMNGLEHVDRILGGKGKDIVNRDKFEYVSIYNHVLGRHEAYYKSLVRQTISVGDTIVNLEEGELINVEYSTKYSREEVLDLVDCAGFYHPHFWTDRTERYDLHLFQRPPFNLFSVKALSDTSRSLGVPSVEEFEEIWKAWDTASLTMIPKGGHLYRPIALRHPYIFYLGHLPAFMDIQLSRCLSLPLTPPENYAEIFERGIDPDLEDPTKCHPHSKVPDEWPELCEIIEFRNYARERMKKILKAFISSVGEGQGDQSVDGIVIPETLRGRLARVIWMCYEHDAMHLETFLYMLIQSPDVLPPAGFMKPLYLDAKIAPRPVDPASLISVGAIPEGVVFGHEDPENDEYPSTIEELGSHDFGWDNERPERRSEAVKAFKLQSRSVTVYEYRRFLVSVQYKKSGDGVSLVPASWNDEATHVKTAFGLVSLDNVPNWPVFVSHVQASAYAQHVGMRLPSEAELVATRLDVSGAKGRGFDGLHGWFGFRGWVPSDAVENLKGWVPGNGWEWTSTEMDSHDGFEASELYPGYTSDFFDGKHNVVLGGSWATDPRMAERLTFRNWYQRGYPFVFATFRCAVDA
ncbi:hypothetical protein HDU76_010380 [Blyttiomyces sp. JEL0837]|nr:hypothetical protein HDU76_010380 [Blyttiomyces sp. JEL0837]